MPAPVGPRPVSVPTTPHAPETHDAHSPTAAHGADHGGHSPALTASHASTVGEQVLEKAHHMAEHALKHMKKDLDLIGRNGDRHGLALPMATLMRDLYTEAV